MPSGEIVKSNAPRRWMTAFLVVLAVAAVAIALLWSQTSSAETASGPSVIEEIWSAGSNEPLKCEMVRVWPLPAECIFVFGH